MRSSPSIRSQVVARDAGQGGQSLSMRQTGSLFDTVPKPETNRRHASAVFVPPPFAADAILEGRTRASNSSSPFTEGIPVRDMIRVRRALPEHPKTG